MSAQVYEPLRVVAPATVNQAGMAWVVQAREAGRRALDAARAVPRTADCYIAQVAHKVHIDAALSWSRRVALRVSRPVLHVASKIGAGGSVAALVGTVTSTTGRAVLSRVGRAVDTALGWVARKTYSGFDGVLGCFGKPGQKAADKLFAGVVSSAARSHPSPRQWSTGWPACRTRTPRRPGCSQHCAGRSSCTA